MRFVKLREFIASLRRPIQVTVYCDCKIDGRTLNDAIRQYRRMNGMRIS